MSQNLAQDLDALANAEFEVRAIEKIRSEITPETHSSAISAKGDKALFGDNQRQESLKQTLHQVIIWGVRIAGILMIVLFVIRIYHLAAPAYPPWIWLDAEQLQKIDSLLFSSFLGAFISRYLHQALPQFSDKTTGVEADRLR